MGISFFGGGGEHLRIKKCDGVAVYNNRKIKHSDEGVWLRTPHAQEV